MTDKSNKQGKDPARNEDDPVQAKQPAREIKSIQKGLIGIYEEFGDQIHNVVDILLELGEGKEVDINTGYDPDGLEDVKRLLEEDDSSDGSRIMKLGKIFGHYDGCTGLINIQWLSDLDEM